MPAFLSLGDPSEIMIDGRLLSANLPSLSHSCKTSPSGDPASSHDEVVHGKGSLLNKMPGDPWQKFANLRMFYAWMYAHPGKKLLFMGCDIGQWKEWNYNKSVEWDLLQHPLHEGLRRLVQHLNFLYKSEPAFSENDDSYAGFEYRRRNLRRWQYR